MLRTNKNYLITEITKIADGFEIVIGYNPTSDSYVCWYCHDSNDYRGGFYSDDVIEVINEYLTRIDS